MRSFIFNIIIAKRTFSGKGRQAPFVIVLVFLSVYCCTYPFEPQITKYENVLVVDGLLTNITGNCFVKISRTYPYNGKPSVLENNASVKIVDDLGDETILKGVDKGLYVPEDSAYAGVTGRKYKLVIRTASGETCESTVENLKEPVDIGDVYYTYKEGGNGINGIQLYVDTYDPLKKSFYYSWDYKETWEFSVPYSSMSNYLPEMKVCYKDVSSRKILIESTKDYIDDKVVGFPLYFVDNTTNRLFIRYSVLVRQYVLNERTYNFYKNLKEINENTGTLFDRTPEILVGNMINTFSDEKPVLGNFQVSGASEKRIFISREELPAGFIVTSEYEFCEGDLLSKKYNLKRLDSLLYAGWAVMDTIYDDLEQDTLIGVVISRACFDCTQKGKIEKPDFWK